MFVGILWKRFGTPTKRAESGTEEEFNRAYQFWKEYGRPHIMFYFNLAPYSPSSLEETEQWGKVLAFQKELGEKGTLYWDYDGPDEFEQEVRRHLTQVVRNWEEKADSPLAGLSGAAPSVHIGTVKDSTINVYLNADAPREAFERLRPRPAARSASAHSPLRASQRARRR